MGRFLLKRVGLMLLTALCLTFIVFALTNLQPNLEKLAKTLVNTRMSDAEVSRWLARHPRRWRRQQRATGLLYLGLGGWAAASGSK